MQTTTPFIHLNSLDTYIAIDIAKQQLRLCGALASYFNLMQLSNRITCTCMHVAIRHKSHKRVHDMHASAHLDSYTCEIHFFLRREKLCNSAELVRSSEVFLFHK